MPASVSPERTVTSPGAGVAAEVAAVAGVAAGCTAGARAGAGAAAAGRSVRAAGAGAAAAGAGAVAAGAAAGALGADVVAVLGGTICVVAPPATVSRPIRSSGGSSRNVYSRTNLPDDQFNSTSRSTNGSLIGCDEVIRTTAVPLARRSTAKRRLLSAGLYSRPAWRKASTGARR